MPTNFKERLKSGWQEWNRWRDKHSKVVPDLRSSFGSDFDLSDYDLSGMNLSHMNLQKAKLARHKPVTHFYGTNFRHANLSQAYLSKSAFMDANLSDANLCGAQLFGTFFRKGTNLLRTNFSEAKLAGAEFTEARLGWTIFGANDLSQVRGLEEAIIEGPITIGIDTVFLSQGKIPNSFLERIQMPKPGIKFIRSITKRPVQYSSCFISYSSRNQEFADQLYRDLIDAGVSSWLATRSLKGGQDFAREIEQSIPSYERFLVLLSRQSINISTWVPREVKIALKQTEKDPNFVVPIVLDNAYELTRKKWVNLLRAKDLIFFGRQRRNERYRESFVKLLTSLEKQNPPEATPT